MANRRGICDGIAIRTRTLGLYCANEPVSPAPLDGLPLADSTHTYLRLCAPSTVGSAAGSGRKVLAVPHPAFAVRVVARFRRGPPASLDSDVKSDAVRAASLSALPLVDE